MSPREIARRLVSRPAWATLAVAAAVRVGLVLHAWSANPLVRRPELDDGYYLKWAAEIAAGDLTGTRPGGIVSGAPWILNALYAYLIAPIVGVTADPRLGTLDMAAMAEAKLTVGGLAGTAPLAVALFQALLGAGTAALAAAAAGRLFGRLGGWTAGLLVAFAATLVQLGTHVATTELAAFLVAGACFACVPAAGSDSPRAHGPLAAGLWLGIGALARPITPLALPFVAWRYARESAHRVRTVAIVVAAFGICAVPSLLRNRMVSGESIVYTAAGGINAHLGNNDEARATRSMTSPHIRFNPIEMHEDARRYVHWVIGRAPSRGEVSSFFWGETIDEAVRHPAASALHYLNKARWFFEATEVPSSASLALDRRLDPWLCLAFVPTWLVACLATAGLWACRRRPEVLLGAGALVVAHWAVLTLVFPLSHYKAPAIPAMAVLAAGAVVGARDAWTGGRRRAALVLPAIAAAFAGIGWVPPGPDPLWMRDEMIVARHEKEAGALESAERHAVLALEAYRRQWGEDNGLPWELIAEVQETAGKWDEALASYDRSLALSPEEPFVRLHRSHVHEMLGNYRDAERDARDVVEKYPFLPEGHGRLGAVLSLIPGREDEARDELQKAIDGGWLPDEAALRRVGLPVPRRPSRE